MKERPILFNGDMVRAILSGEKTQTRRMVKHIPAVGGPDAWCHKKDYQETVHIIGDYRRFCPFGKVGDRLWVRETWRGIVKINGPREDYKTGVAKYIPDSKNCVRIEYAISSSRDSEPWRPSIHMPRWASRIMLEIVDVRIERLNSISEEDAKAEGTRAPIQFALLWDSIYKNWHENPWVWVVEFKRVEVM